MVIPVSDKFVGYARTVYEQLLDAHLRAEVNLKDDRVGYKIREVSLQKIPYAIVVGEKEQNAKNINVRSRDEGELGPMEFGGFMSRIDAQKVPGTSSRKAAE